MTDGPLPDPLFRRIDHLLLRCEPATYDRVLELFRDTLGLPAPWPVSRHAAFISGGVALGNVPLEILSMGPPRKGAPDAMPFGIALEAVAPLERVVPELLRRKVNVSGLLPYLREEGGEQKHLWTNANFLDVTGRSFWLSLFGWITRRAGAQTRRSKLESESSWSFFNRVFARGMFFGVEYVPPFQGPMQSLEQLVGNPVSRPLGPLGVVETKEVVVSARDPAFVRAAWQRLLRSPPDADPSLFRLAQGPAIRVVPGPRDGVERYVLRVASFPEARAFLQGRGMLGAETPEGIAINPEKMFGLRFTLTG